MTPAEHYAEAERLAAAAVTEIWRGQDIEIRAVEGEQVEGPLVALGQLHATLATAPEGRAVLAAAGEPDTEAVLAATLRELRAVLEEFHAVKYPTGPAMSATMPNAALVERINRLAALERGDLVAYQAAQQ